MDNVFLQISTLLAITTAIAFAAKLLKQPLIIGYIVAGIISGPLFFNIVHGGHEMYEAFAQFGVILLLFIIGLNLDLNHLREIGRISFITGLGQFFFTIFFGTLLLLWLDFPIWSSIFLAGAVTFSSTIIIMKLLTEKKDTETVYGKHTIGLMLVQDLLAIAMIVIIGFMKSNVNAPAPLVIFALKILIVSAAIFIFAKYFLPKFLPQISGSSEMLFLFTIGWCFGIASIFYISGFSIELGAIISGISLASSPFRLEIGSRIKALRDFFLVLFFIVLGAEMGLEPLSSIWWPSLVISTFILIGNPLILYFLFRSLKFTRRNSLLAGLTAAQVSEFGFVLLYAGASMGLVTGRELSTFTTVALATIFASSYLIIYNEKIYRFLLPAFNKLGPDKYLQKEKPEEKYDAWVIGYHRIGAHIAKAVREKKMSVGVIDFDPSASKRILDPSISFFFGDAADLEFIENLPLTSSRLVVMTIPAIDDQLTLINHLKKSNSKAFIIANAYQYWEIEKLYKAGADYVMMPHLIGGDWIASILKEEKWNKDAFNDLRKEQQEMLDTEKILFI